MALLKIITYPNEILTRKSLPIIDFGAATQKFFDDMIETMYVEDGVGLAAPQVGVSKRVFTASPQMKRGEEVVIVNPEIYETSGREKGMEGCLSFPGLSGEIFRAKKLRMRFQDRNGAPHDIDAKDFFARIIQHEMDHLDGILFIDRVEFQQRQDMLSSYGKH